jgi:hypothetical protein
MVKSSSIALSSVLKKPMQMKSLSQPSGSLTRTTSTESKLSIFHKPRVVPTLPTLRQENQIYNGIGGTAKVLQSDLKTPSSWPATSSTKTDGTKKKKLSPTFIK